MKTQYWIVAAVGSDGKIFQTRVSERVATAKEACIDCYGTCTEGLIAKPCGSLKSTIQSDKKFKALLDEKAGWIRFKTKPFGTVNKDGK